MDLIYLDKADVLESEKVEVKDIIKDNSKLKGKNSNT
jgi:hypothetical protein